MAGFIDRFNDSTKANFYSLMDDASWIKQGGGSVEIKVEFNSEAQDDELGNAINIQEPIAGVYVEDVVGIAVNDVLAVQDEQYKIIDMLPTGDGWLELMLRKIS